MAFTDGKLLTIARAAQFRIGAGILWGAANFRRIDAAYRLGAEETRGTLPVPAPKTRAFLGLGDAAALDVRRRRGMVFREHRHHVFAAAFVFPTGQAIIAAADGICPQYR